MWRRLGTAWNGIAALLVAGCATGPLVENPVLIRSEKVIAQENPLYIPQGQGAATYARVFEKTLDILDDYFEIAYMNRYAGLIETQPTVAPGFEQPWKPGSPDCYQRLLAFLQTIRHRAIVTINTADDGGYWISVKVLKELEDFPIPIRATAGSATFRMFSTVERQFEVIESSFYQAGWIPIGRDYKLEQVILERLAKCDFKSLPRPTPVSGP
jgi:hypothetical protein